MCLRLVNTGDKARWVSQTRICQEIGEPTLDSTIFALYSKKRGALLSLPTHSKCNAWPPLVSLSDQQSWQYRYFWEWRIFISALKYIYHAPCVEIV